MEKTNYLLAVLREKCIQTGVCVRERETQYYGLLTPDHGSISNIILLPTAKLNIKNNKIMIQVKTMLKK